MVVLSYCFICCGVLFFFFFSSRRRHTRWTGDWSSDVCSSDLPRRSSLLEPGDTPGVILSGRVLNEKGTPIPGAVVNFWSSDLYGNYDMVGYRYTGYVVTDEAGRYEVTTIMPGYYQPRNARHIHVKVQAVSRPVTTQLYFEGEPGNTDDEYYHPALLVPCTVDDDGIKHGSYDFVIKQITE